MICTNCLTTFFQDPLNIGIAAAAVILSAIFLLYSRRAAEARKKVKFLYAHIFFLIFPIFFYMFFSGCSALMKMCQEIAPMFTMILGSVFLTFIIVSLIGPTLFIKKYIKKSNNLHDTFISKTVREYARRMNLKIPAVHIINTAKPVAFSLSALKKKIFISMGMMELLNKKELEAVVLHELGHIKHKSSTVKFWTLYAKYLSPFAAFSHTSLDQEELDADAVAIQFQQTNKFVRSAKQKLQNFESYHSFSQR